MACCLFVSLPQLKPWGSPNVEWEDIGRGTVFLPSLSPTPCNPIFYPSFSAPPPPPTLPSPFPPTLSPPPCNRLHHRHPSPPQCNLPLLPYPLPPPHPHLSSPSPPPSLHHPRIPPHPPPPTPHPPPPHLPFLPLPSFWHFAVHIYTPLPPPQPYPHQWLSLLTHTIRSLHPPTTTPPPTPPTCPPSWVNGKGHWGQAVGWGELSHHFLNDVYLDFCSVSYTHLVVEFLLGGVGHLHCVGDPATETQG